MRKRPIVWLLPALLLSCRAGDYVRDADNQVYGILDERQQNLFGAGLDPLRIEAEEDRLRVLLLAELDRHRALERQRLEDEARGWAAEDGEATGEGATEGTPSPEPTGPEGAPRPMDSTEPEGATPRIPDADPLEGEPPPELRGPRVDRSQDGDQDQDPVLVGGPDLDTRLQEIEARYSELFTPPSATDPPVLPLKVLRLTECLEIAAANSRQYQTEKERVYLAALDLTFERYRFENQYGVSTSYDWSSTPGSPRTRTGDLTTTFSLTRTLASGGFLVFDFTNSFLKRFTGFGFSSADDDEDFGSLLNIAFTQPLLRGAGREVVQEPLVQAEREVIYALREFERFRREFAVQVASQYYNLLRQVDSIDNARRRYVGVIDSRELAENLRRLGRSSQIDLDRARTDELNSRNNWVAAINRYESSLDSFKILLGLPVETYFAPDPSALEGLVEQGLTDSPYGEAEAIDIALHHRLDFQNDLAFLDDAERRVHVAENALKASLDLNGGVAIPTDRDTFVDFEMKNAVYSAGVELDLPVDRLAERNAYRRSLINLDAQQRATTLSEDNLKLGIRASLRDLVDLAETYRIQTQAVEVAERRVRATSMQLRKGREPIREVLEATDALAQARNVLTAALTDYRVATLQLYLDMGLLRLTEDGVEFARPEDEGTEP